MTIPPPRSPEQRGAVIAAILAGSTLTAAAAAAGVPERTARGWMARWRRDHGGDAVSAKDAAKTIAAHTPDALGAAIEGYVLEGLAALRAQVKIAADPVYLASLSGRDLGVMHGIMADKLVTVLRSIRPDDEDTAE